MWPSCGASCRTSWRPCSGKSASGKIPWMTGTSSARYSPSHIIQEFQDHWRSSLASHSGIAVVYKEGGAGNGLVLFLIKFGNCFGLLAVSRLECWLESWETPGSREVGMFTWRRENPRISEPKEAPEKLERDLG